MKRLAACAILMLAGAAASGEPALEQIRTQRSEATAALAAKERECAARFVVAACLDAARTAHRETLARLRREEIALVDARRHAAAEARRKELADKAAATAGRASEPPVEPPQVRLRRTRPQAPVASPQLLDSLAPPGAGPATTRASTRGADEARHRAQFATRQRAMQAKREAVELRNQERRAQGKVAAPLPLPAGAP